MYKNSLALSILASFLVVSSASAQYSTSWVGIRAGANFASESFASMPTGATTGMRFGIIGGLAYEHWFDENWAVAASALFDQKGVHEEYASASIDRPDNSGNDDYALSYVEIPLVVKYAIGDGDIRPFIFAGPSFGILLSASETADATTGITPVTDLKSNLQTTDVSAYFGVGFMDRIYRGPTIVFDAGYAAGLTKVYKTTPVRDFPLPIDPTNAKSGDIRVTLGVLWQL